MPLEIAFMKFSYAIMIFDIMLFEFHSRETVIIEISFGVKQSFGMETKIRLPVRHGTQKPILDFRFSGKSTLELIVIPP